MMDYVDTTNTGLDRAKASHHVVRHPNLWLIAALRDVVQPHQKHVVEGHEALPDLPLFVGGLIDGVRILWFNLGQPQRSDATKTPTYGHRV